MRFGGWYNHRYKCNGAAVAIGAWGGLFSVHEHLSEKPQGDDSRDDVFPAYAGQDSSTRAR